MKIALINKQTRGLWGTRVLLRLDLNVPLRGKRITNDYKLLSALPTIKLLLALRCKIVIVTHLGEPTAKKSDRQKYSLKPIAAWLEKKLRRKVRLIDGSWSAIDQERIVILENIRFFPGEINNSLVFAQRLAKLADVYVNDAFAVSHRAHASISAIKKFLPSYAGPLLAAEIKNLERAKSGKRPLVLVMGGAKIATKIPLLKALGPRAYKVLVGGAVAMTILKARGFNIGVSLWDKEGLAIARRLSFSNIVLPKDVGVLSRGKRYDKSVKKIAETDNALDIGPVTVAAYLQFLKKAKTIIWNGPLGVFEKPFFAWATKQIAQGISLSTRRGAFSLIGGGETVASVAAKSNHFSWVSTGGGATLAYLAGQKMPGLTGIISYKK